MLVPNPLGEILPDPHLRLVYGGLRKEPCFHILCVGHPPGEEARAEAREEGHGGEDEVPRSAGKEEAQSVRRNDK